MNIQTKIRTVIKKPEKQQVFLPEWMNKQIALEDLDRLRLGKKTQLLELVDENGKKLSGKMQVFTNGKESTINFHKVEKKKQLEIGEEIEGIKIDKKQIKLLKSGKFISLNDGLYAAVDKDLNKVVLHTGKELETIQQVGDYKLSKEDKLSLLNGESLTKVLKNQNGNHVITSFKFDTKNNQIEFDLDQTKVISPEEANKYDLGQKIDELNIGNTEPNRIIKDFLDGNDKAMVQLTKLKSQGFNPSMDKLIELTNGADSLRSNAMLGAFNLDSKEFDRLKDIYEEKGVFEPSSPTQHKLEKININDKTITMSDKGVEKTMKLNKVKTVQEQKVHLQSKSRGRMQSKGMGLN